MPLTALDRRRAEVEAKQAERRARMPATCANLDDLRALFGADVKLTHAVEPTGEVYGKPGPQGVVMSDTRCTVKPKKGESRVVERAVASMKQRSLV